jgi:uncharacterized membrane protein YccC
MDSVKIYWKDPLFLIGMFLAFIGTLLTVGGLHHLGVLSALAGFAITTIAIYIIEAKNKFN